jgi:hypothetical protein
MVRRDAELVKKPDERGRILSFRLGAAAKRAKIEPLIAHCDHFSALLHLVNEHGDLRTRITGQHHIAVEPDSGIDVAGDKFHQRRLVIPGMLMALGYWRIRVEELAVGFQEASLPLREAEVAHLNCASRSSIRKGLKED